MERLGWYMLVIVCIILMIGLAFFIGSERARGDELTVTPAIGTVERRIHLTVDTRYDTDKRRKFECREVK